MSRTDTGIIITAGDRYGMWTLVADLGTSVNGGARSARRCLARCDCGTTKVLYFGALKRGSSRSCGCARDRFLKERPYLRGLRYRCIICNADFAPRAAHQKICSGDCIMEVKRRRERDRRKRDPESARRCKQAYVLRQKKKLAAYAAICDELGLNPETMEMKT